MGRAPGVVALAARDAGCPRAFRTYFSGAPVVYPPLGATSGQLGGRPGARRAAVARVYGLATTLSFCMVPPENL